MTKQSHKASEMVCDICGKHGAIIRHVTRSYGKGARLLVIENVPLISCPHCGESYMSAATLHGVEEIKRKRVSFANKRPVAVAVFSEPRLAPRSITS